MYSSSFRASDLAGVACSTDAEREDIFTLFLFGQALGSLEHFKNHMPVINIGVNAGDQIFSNLRSRISGVFAADDESLQLFAQRNQFRLTDGRFENLPAGPLRVTLSAQEFIGDQMLRTRWENTALPSGKHVLPYSATNSNLISFSEFAELFKENKDFRSAFASLHADIQDLNRGKKFSWDRLRKQSGNRKGWLRLPALHSSLLDLIDFVDPGPFCRFVPLHRRIRMLGVPASNLPLSMRQTINAMAQIRDGRSLHASDLESMAIMVRGRKAGHEIEAGVCTWSQTLIFALETMKVPYRCGYVLPEETPQWYRDLQPEGTPPLMMHNAKIIEDNISMIQHLQTLKPLSKDQKPLRTYSSKSNQEAWVISNLHDHFLDWVTESGLKPLSEVSKGKHLKKEITKPAAGSTLLRDLSLVEAMLNTNLQKDKPLLGGTSPCSADVLLGPILSHFDVLKKRFETQGPQVNLGPTTREYLRNLYLNEAFKKSQPPEDLIVERYSSMASGEEKKKKEIMWERSY